MIEILHALPGRVRFRIPEIRRDRKRAERLDQALRLTAGFQDVVVNPITGSILVRFPRGQPLRAVSAAISHALKAAGGEGRVRPAGAGRLPLLRLSPEEASRQPWHRMQAREVLGVFKVSSSAGLSRREAGRRRLQGANTLPVTASRTFGIILQKQMTELPVLLVAAAAGLAIVAGGVVEGVAALAIALANALASSIAENRSERLLDEVRAAVELRARVLRGREIFEVGFDEVVPGDILDLGPGSRIPADARVIRSERLSVDEAALTGESIPVLKSAAVPNDADPPLSQRTNMVYRGTLVVEGTGRAVVVATGAETVLGRLQSFLGAVFPPEAAVARDMRRWIRHLLAAGVGAAGAYGLFSLMRGHGILQVLKEALAIAAGAIPSGLSTLSASAFAFGHRDLRRRRILVRRLRALGNLASTQIVCLDKTGTLTWNQMTVAGLCVGFDPIDLGPEGKELPEPLSAAAAGGDLDWLVRLGVLCNEAFMLHEGTRSLEGSSTEAALIQFAEDRGIHTTRFRGEHPIVEIFHRSEHHPYMVTVHQWDANRELTAVKGAPFEVLEHCSHYRRGGEVHPLTEEARARIEAENFRMAGRGLRVLGLAFRWGRQGTEGDRYLAGPGLVWAGLVGLSDPLRPEAKGLVASLHQAGIRTAVLTGDQSLTAQYIGNQLGLSGSEPLRILDAAELRGAALNGLREVVPRTHVFARLTPTQKLQIIQSYQSAGLSVVMVGDGFNDVLALKVADVGMAMGRQGAEMACKAADLILEDDDLGGVFAAIQSGRRFYRNMHRSLRFLTGATYVDLAAAVAKTTGAGALSPLQPVWNNAAALALAVDPEDGEEFGGLQEAEAARIEGGRVRGALSDATAVLAASGLVGGYALSRYGSGAHAGRVFWAGVGFNQGMLALREKPPGRRPGAMPRSTRLLWAAAAMPLLVLALTGGGGVLDLLAVAGGGWLARRLLAQAGPGKPPRPSASAA